VSKKKTTVRIIIALILAKGLTLASNGHEFFQGNLKEEVCMM
jgi:hypothetical protein